MLNKDRFKVLTTKLYLQCPISHVLLPDIYSCHVALITTGKKRNIYSLDFVFASSLILSRYNPFKLQGQ